MSGTKKEQIKDGQVHGDHTYAKGINTTSIDMMLNEEGYQIFEDPEYVQGILDSIKSNTTVTTLDKKGYQEFLDPQCVKQILDMIESNMEVKQNPSSTLYTPIVSNSRNQNNRSLRVTNSKNRYPKNAPYNLRGRNDRNTRNFYNLRERNGGKKNNSR